MRHKGGAHAWIQIRANTHTHSHTHTHTHTHTEREREREREEEFHMLYALTADDRQTAHIEPLCLTHGGFGHGRQSPRK